MNMMSAEKNVYKDLKGLLGDYDKSYMITLFNF